jgi:transcriptional/translational regulatory protein YebC/TACO1
MSGHMKWSEIKKRSKAAPEALAIARADLERELEASSKLNCEVQPVTAGVSIVEGPSPTSRDG